MEIHEELNEKTDETSQQDIFRLLNGDIEQQQERLRRERDEDNIRRLRAREMLNPKRLWDNPDRVNIKDYQDDADKLYLEIYYELNDSEYRRAMED